VRDARLRRCTRIRVSAIATAVMFLAASSQKAIARDFEVLGDSKDWIVFFGDPKDWIVGIVAGIIGGLIVIVLASLRVPKLGISKSIADTDGVQRIKIINKRRQWWPVFLGDAVNVKARLHLFKDNDITNELTLVNDEVQVLFHRKFFKKSRQNEYVFRVKSECNTKTKLSEPGDKYLRFQVTATDSFSNYSRTYSQIYYPPLVSGDFQPGDIAIVPSQLPRRSYTGTTPT
jgi:hypothetical protein